jgi:putative transposase
VPTARSFHRADGVFHVEEMVRAQLREKQWTKIEAVLESQRGAGRHGRNDRKFIEAVLWWRRTGVPWRDLPDDFGPWKTVFNRFDRWSKRGKWTRLFEALRTDTDDEWHSLDSTINRAHQHAAGGKGGLRPKGSVARVAASRPRCI